MQINLQELNYKDEILINDKIVIPLEYLSNSDIIRINYVTVTGNIKYDLEDNYIIKLEVNGQMILHDALTFEEVPYDFSIDIEEILEKSCKSIDLIEFLWHYIVLEIPLRYTLSNLELEVKNNDYQVISEEEYEDKNPFKDFFKE